MNPLLEIGRASTQDFISIITDNQRIYQQDYFINQSQKDLFLFNIFLTFIHDRFSYFSVFLPVELSFQKVFMCNTHNLLYLLPFISDYIHFTFSLQSLSCNKLNKMLQENFQTNQRSQLSSTQILQRIKKTSYTQQIGGIQFTYSILNKKQQTFVLSNLRFLYLKGIQSISYARQFPQNRPLPFNSIAELPQPKATYHLSEIQNFDNDQEKLIIQFSGEKKVKWQFICPSTLCALEWKQKLSTAIHNLSEFNQSGFDKYEDYLKSKAEKAKPKYSNNNNEMNSLLGTSGINYAFLNDPHYNNMNFAEEQYGQTQMNNQTLHNSTNRLQSIKPEPSSEVTSPNNINSAINSKMQQSNIMPITNIIQEAMHKDQRQYQIQLNGSSHGIVKDGIEHHNINKPFGGNQKHESPISIMKQTEKKIERPHSVMFKGPQMTKVQSFILEEKPQAQNLTRSIASMSISGKQNLKSTIDRLRRDWIQELLTTQDEVELFIDFKNYVEKIAQILVNELSVSQEERIYPQSEHSKTLATYKLQDVTIQLYFYSEQHLIDKNPRHQQAVRQFKNFDHLLGCTKNQGILRVPLMVLFEFKGFLGSAKCRVGDSTRLRNKQAYNMLDRKYFEQQTRVSPDVLLDEQNCKIIAYEKVTSFSKTLIHNEQLFFVDKLNHFLPSDSDNSSKSAFKLLRPEFILDEELDNVVFNSQYSPKPQRINYLVSEKIKYLVASLQNQKEYITNSKELSELIHYIGLNMRNLGIIYKTITQNWLKKIIQSEIIARCLKNFYRFDMQNSVFLNMDKSAKKQRQIERQKNRVISFLNVVFGNTQTTFRFWRNLNNSAQQIYDVKIWQNQFTDINVNYLFQAIQTNLKFVLSPFIHEKKPFKSMNTFDADDFVRFQFDSTIYNLEFTQLFQEINECLEENSFQSFHDLCETLIKQTTNKVPYFQILKTHQIHDKISEFLLQFTSPEESPDLYNRIQSKTIPTKFTYESKLAEIKWYLKQGRHESIHRTISFIQDHVKRWIGEAHPVLTHLNRILAEFYAESSGNNQLALKYANASLELQLALFGGESEELWKDFFLLGRIYFANGFMDDALKYLSKSKVLVNIHNLPNLQVYSDLCLMLAKCFFARRLYKQAYNIVKQLYKLLREQKDEQSLRNVINSVTMIKQLLEMNQEHESFYLFIQSDFSQIIGSFVDNEQLMLIAVKLIALPYLKNVLLKNGKNRLRLLSVIDEISKMAQSFSSCLSFLRIKINEGSFPQNYLHFLKDIEAILEEIQKNQMIQRWKGFNKMANQNILQKIVGSQINKGFQFLALLTALFNLLGAEGLENLLIMEK